MWFIFALITTLAWGLAELFYKKGARQDEKYAHLKICVAVGIVMGIHAIFTLLTQDIGYNPVNLVRYLPVSLLYILSMTFSFFGMRFIEESISDPIENTSGAMCTVMCVLFLGDKIAPLIWVAVAIIVIGILGVSREEKSAGLERKKKLGKKLLVCVGDAQNDVPMLDGADYAFCPSDASIADRYPNVCSCDEGAIADVILKELPKIFETL